MKPNNLSKISILQQYELFFGVRYGFLSEKQTIIFWLVKRLGVDDSLSSKTSSWHAALYGGDSKVIDSARSFT